MEPAWAKACPGEAAIGDTRPGVAWEAFVQGARGALRVRAASGDRSRERKKGGRPKDGGKKQSKKGGNWWRYIVPKRNGESSKYYLWEFVYQGKRFQESTGATSKKVAKE